MDDDEDEREFSKSIVYDFFTQAENTFDKMHTNLYSHTLHPSSPTTKIIASQTDLLST